MFSSRSVVTPDDFLGHDTHNIPAGASCFAVREKCFFKSAWLLVKSIAKSSGHFGSGDTSHARSASRNSERTSAGNSMNVTRNFSLMPNFLGRGVPEYPAMADYCTGAKYPRRERTCRFFLSRATISMVRKRPSALKSAGL